MRRRMKVAKVEDRQALFALAILAEREAWRGLTLGVIPHRWMN